jgi:hypothetical protein
MRAGNALRSMSLHLHELVHEVEFDVVAELLGAGKRDGEVGRSGCVVCEGEGGK